MFQLLDHRSNQVGHQPSGRTDLKGLCSPSLLPGPSLQIDPGSISQRIEHLLGKVLFVEGNSVGGGGEPFDVIRKMRPSAAHVGKGLEIGALLRGARSERFEFLEAEAHDFAEPVSIDPVPGDEYTRLFQPQAERAHVFAAAWDADASFLEPAAEPVEVDVFAGGLHVEHALNEIHAMTVLQDVPRKGFVEGRIVMSEVMERAADPGGSRVLPADEAIGAHGELGVVGELVLVVGGCVASGEVSIPDGRFETFPVGPVLMRQLQKHRKVDLGRRELAAEGKIASRHGGRPTQARLRSVGAEDRPRGSCGSSRRQRSRKSATACRTSQAMEIRCLSARSRSSAYSPSSSATEKRVLAAMGFPVCRMGRIWSTSARSGS